MASSVCKTLSPATHLGYWPQLSPPTTNFSSNSAPPSCIMGGETKSRNDYHNYVGERKASDDTGGWTSLQGLSVQTGRDDDIYIHPQVKRAATKLSDKSLQMCTESLGNESGGDSGDEMSFLWVEARESRRPREAKIKKIAPTNVYPPPITSLCNSSGDGIRVIKRREDGRLILEAVNVDPQSYFRAQRTEGRLRLYISDHPSYEDNSLMFSQTVSKEEEYGFLQEEGGSITVGEEEGEEEEEEVEEDEEEKDMDTNAEYAEGRSVCGRRLRRLNGRCKEEGPERNCLVNWEQVLLASS